MPKIICTVTNDLSQDQRMIRICSSLQAAGYEVELVGRQLPHSLPLVDHPFAQKRLKCWYVAGKLFYLEYNLRLLWYLFWQRADVINAVDLDSLLPAYLVSRLRSTIVVYDAHEYFTEVPEVIRRPRVQKVWSALADWIIPRLQYAYTVGPALAKLMSERYGIPYGVVRNVPHRKVAPNKPPAADPKIMLYQGMLNEGRGLEALILAMKELVKEATRTDSPEVVLWLAGNGDVKEELEVLVKQNGLENHVRFLGFIPPADLPTLTEQAWLGLNLLENTGLSYYYSLANKTFDYVQAGVPALHMDFPEYVALQERYAAFVLVPDLQVNTLVAAVRSLLDDPEQYEKLRTNNLQAAKELVWEREEDSLLAVYREIFGVYFSSK